MNDAEFAEFVGDLVVSRGTDVDALTIVERIPDEVYDNMTDSEIDEFVERVFEEID